MRLIERKSQGVAGSLQRSLDSSAKEDATTASEMVPELNEEQIAEKNPHNTLKGFYTEPMIYAWIALKSLFDRSEERVRTHPAAERMRT